MFTGIIEETGSIAAVTELPDARTFRISAQHVLDGVTHGDSIAVNGVCLTVIAAAEGDVHADVGPETLRVTALGGLDRGAIVVDGVVLNVQAHGVAGVKGSR